MTKVLAGVHSTVKRISYRDDLQTLSQIEAAASEGAAFLLPEKVGQIHSHQNLDKYICNTPGGLEGRSEKVI